uniref:Putative clathrin coat associated protein ap-50 n=1 Tax=Schistosoma mansoni TaxID=6183 RepID=A0A5K4EB59_SCHMA
MSYDIDDSLYSRQRCVLGENAMIRMCKSKVFLHGLGGVGIEIAKSLILAGVGELIIQDQSLCCEQDLGTQFCVDQCSVKASKTRAEASLDRLTALNPYVRITLKTGNVTDIRCPLSDPANKTILKPLVDEGSSTKVDCLVLTKCSLQQATLLDLFCRAHDIKFIYTDIYGVFGNLFCDFGSDFTVLTQDDEPCREFFIGKIEKINDEELLITVLGNHRHHLENNDVIRFTELKNVPMLNEREFPIRVKSPSELIITTSIKDIQFPYSDGGFVLQVKKPQVHTFETMLEQIKDPKLMCVDFSKPEEGNLLHLTYLTLMRFNVETGRYPKPWDENDWNLFRDQLFTIQKLQMPIEINESLVKRLTFASQGQLAPLCAIFGGIAAQEAMKAITFTFTPINQWLYIHCASIVPLEINTKSNEFQNYLSSRYADLVQCIGVSNLQKIHNLSVFMVGCGAIGCELLKNLALLGVATAGSNDDDLHSANNVTDSNQHQYGQQENNKQFTYTTALDTSLMSHENDDVEDDHQTLSHSEVDSQQFIHSNSSYPEDKLTDNSETNVKSIISHQVSISQRQSIKSVQSESINSMFNMSCPNITVTDPDHIEKSNLNRQFLFQSCHIGLSKSQIACDTVKRINPSISVRAMGDKFWPNTEKSIFTDEFLLQATKCSNYKQGITSSSFSSSHKHGIVLAALDCVPTRRYLDSRCVTLHLPLIESGTLGTKGHVQVILPDITESYNSQMDDNNDIDGNGNIDSQVNTIPYCTLKSFPTLPIHCIEWAREKFASQFTLKPMKLQTFLQVWNFQQNDSMNSYHGEQTLQKQTHQLISDLIFLMDLCNENTPTNSTTTTTTTTDNNNSSNVIVTSKIYANDKILMKNWIERMNLLQDQLSPNIGRFLCSRPSTWNECLYLARDKFQHYFNHKARQLLHSFPIDTKLSDGSPFWQFPKRPPKSIEYSITDPLHQTFVISYARLLAAQLSIQVPQSCFSISNSLSSSTSPLDFSTLLNYGSTELVNYLQEVFVNYIPPIFTPSNKHIVTDENEPKPQQTITSTSPSLPKDNDHTIMSMKRIIFSNPSLNDDDGDDDSTIKEICLNESFLKMCTNILESLGKPEKFKVISSCQSVTFEKDDDNLAHVDFVTSAANLRATMYSLPITARHVVKRIAGRIVPAIATTTATVAGLVCLELLKYVINNNQYDVNGGHVGSFASEEEISTMTATTTTINDPEQRLIQLKSRNSFLNLALPILLFSEPGLCRQIRLPNGKYFSLWDRWIIRPCKSIDKYRLTDFIDQIKNDFNLVVSLITQGNRMVYMHHFPMHKSRFNEIFINLLNYSPMDSHIDLMVAYESDHMKMNNDHSHGNNDDDGGCIQGPTIRFQL